MFVILVLILASCVQNDAARNVPNVMCLGCDLDCEHADTNTLDILFFFGEVVKYDAMETVDKIKAKFNPRNRDGVYIRVIQYNTNASRSNCPQGVECQPVGFKEAYARVVKTLPLYSFYYKSVSRVAVHLIDKNINGHSRCGLETMYDVVCVQLELDEWKTPSISITTFQTSPEQNDSIKIVCKLRRKSQSEVEYELLKNNQTILQNFNGVFWTKRPHNFHGPFTCKAYLYHNRVITSSPIYLDSRNQVKLSLDVVDESVGYDNKIEVDCHLSGTPFGARPVSFELLKDGISVENKTDENQRYVIGGISDIDLCKFTCSAHYMYGVSISQRVDFVLMAGPPRNLKKNRSVIMKSGESIDIHCHNGRRQDADFSFRFNGNPLPELSNNGGTTYIIKHVTKSDSGIYKCNASNNFGSAMRFVNVTVV